MWFIDQNSTLLETKQTFFKLLIKVKYIKNDALFNLT